MVRVVMTPSMTSTADMAHREWFVASATITIKPLGFESALPVGALKSGFANPGSAIELTIAATVTPASRACLVNVVSRR